MGEHWLLCWLARVSLYHQAICEFDMVKKQRKLMSCIHSNMKPVPNAAYGPTKVVLHWLTKAISVEEPWLTAFPIDPGYVYFPCHFPAKCMY